VSVKPVPDSACGLKTAGDRKIAPTALVRGAIHPMHAHLTHNGIGLNFGSCQLCLHVTIIVTSLLRQHPVD
jgi:hypothetical protein